ncbi:sensor histidine kinase [Pseudomonas sp. RL_15y_Pfl2_60]|uniref:sensor histidine kinase n=1 Tax=Pseudomonas sp. RL_15y_Pfl2_60 TaxID=3088709 RepID=UPI0030D7B21D
MRTILILLLAVWPVLAGAVTFDEHTRSVDLGRASYVLEDASGAATIDQVSSADFAPRFKRQSEQVLNAGYSRSVFWLRVDLDYQPLQLTGEKSWLLELAYPPLDHLMLYMDNGRGGFDLLRTTGDALPYVSREIKNNNFLFELGLQPDQPRRVYLRLQSQGSIQAPLKLWAPNAYIESQPTRIYVLGIIYGVLLGMMVYNLFIYLSVRDTSYLYYILYIASFGLYQVSVNGAGIAYFWPDNPWWANAATPFLIGSATFFGTQFARSFLQTAQHGKWLDRSLLIVMLVAVLVMVLALTASYALSLRLATYLALVFTLVVFYAGLAAWWSGMRVARYFIFAWSAFLLGGIVNTLMVLGFLPNVFITMYASQIGSALEVALLSLALADRINVLKEERTAILQSARRELESLNQALANNNRLKDEFLATISHELRTPMNGVIGSLDLLQTVRLDNEMEQYRSMAQGSAQEMMRMINNILVLTELQAGRLYPLCEPFSLRVLIDSLSDQYMPLAQGKGLEFVVEYDETLADELEGDLAKLRLSIGILLDNAIKFTDKGRVTLRINPQPDAQHDVPLCIDVIDTGAGFNQAHNNSLYQCFQQLDGSMTRRFGGLGIGLAICRQMVALLGGDLSHESQPGKGSHFKLKVRLALAGTLAAKAHTQRQPS